MSAAKVASASATIEAAVVIASVPPASSGAENSIAPTTSPSATVVSLVCNFKIAPSAVLIITSSPKLLFVHVSVDTRETRVELEPAGNNIVLVTAALWG